MSVSTEKRSRREAISSRQVGRYQVTSVLGQGAMGVVYRGHDPLLNRHVAIKVMAASLAADPAVKARFEREAQAAARLAHPNVVTVHDFGYYEGAPFVVMELLRGQDLRTALQRGAELPLERKLSILFQVLAGLAHAHGSGVVHRDVKPANVFLTESGGVKVLDFGMARVTWAGSTGTGSVVGTIDYMSPEQVEGRRADGRSDVFSVGAVLFELLVGEPPFRTESLVSTAYRIVHGEPDFGRLPEGEPYAALEPVLRQALAKDVAARYRSAYDFATELAERGGAPWASWPVETMPEPLSPAPPASDGAALALEEPEARFVPPSDQPTTDLGLSLAPATGAAPPVPAPAVGPRRLWWGTASLLAAGGLVAYSALRPRPVSAPAGDIVSPIATPLTEPPPTLATRRLVGRGAPAASSSETVPETSSPLSSVVDSSILPRGTATVSPAPASRGVEPPLPTTLAPERLTTARWTGFITDESCKRRGAVGGHWDCAQICMRKGFKPLLDVDGTLYRIDGIERIKGDKNRMVTVEGILEPRTNTIRVAGGS